MTLNYYEEDGILDREQIEGPRSFNEAKERIYNYKARWRNLVQEIDEEQFTSSDRVKCPFDNQLFYKLATWLNLEFIKNVTEIGCVRFMYVAKDNMNK